MDQGGPISCLDAGSVKKAMGQPCGCGTDCQSGFCADGVCCNSACGETCKACNVPATLGTCSFVPPGLKPRSITTCVQSDVSSCGLDGTCDGMGACRKWQMGSVCRGGTCDGDALVGINVCDGDGLCLSGASRVCAPFTCDEGKKNCFNACTKNSDCVSGRQCVNGTCGKRPKGAACVENVDCVSGFCTDGVCCSVACQGACVSCKLVGHEGTCWPIDPGNPDPRNICKDMGAASCGQTGACDGFGSCEKYAAETICVAASCSGDRRNTPGTCDGQGSCRPPGVQECPPFRCVGGACNATCTSNADCVAGIACVNGSCGPKQNGQVCTAPAQCASGQCVDGVCCADACQGACRSCALPSSMGRCTSLAAGTADNRGVCTDQGAAMCKNDGKCDGAGGCRKYAVGTVCSGEKCSGNVYTPPSQCTATGQCMAPNSRPCAPFACNGQRCFDACTMAANCVAPNVCNGNSCGKKINGAECSEATECASNQCFQGVCCATTCNNACKSCALPGTAGACTNVPTGSTDPHNTCVDQGAASCGTNGKCAAGACQRYGSGTSCKDPTCMTSTFTGRSTCDGSGTCVTPGSTSCFPFACGVAACNGTCAAPADCALGAVCINGSCGLKPKGAACAATPECATGLVCSAQGVCCDGACNGPCVSCTLTNSLGTCSPVADGASDPNSMCTASLASSCGNDGFCNGAGGCRKWASGTQCVAPTCSAPYTVTNASQCNGTGTCVAGGTRDCDPYACSSMACNTACTSNADCKPPTICDVVTGMCGNKKPLGAACTVTADCLTGNSCTDGVCCTTASCGTTCQACNVDGSGSCKNVANGAMEPHNRCAAAPPCGNTGLCQAGACQQAPNTTSCGAAMCASSTFTPQRFCNGAGACNPAAPTSCNDSNMCTSDSCGLTGCVNLANVSCNDSNACTNDVCNPSTGCSNTAVNCDDGNPCTTDTCNTGSGCVHTPIVCTASDQCHNAGTCDTSTGMCSNPAKGNGTSCNDGDACTLSDACTGGVCGGTPMACTAMDQCHVAGICTGGVCSNPAKPNGDTCNDGDACSLGDTCTGGVCGGTPMVCTAMDECHVAGTCTGGVCSNPAKPDMTMCNDGMACTDMDSCQGGICTGTAITCPVGTNCDPGNGMCI